MMTPITIDGKTVVVFNLPAPRRHPPRLLCTVTMDPTNIVIFNLPGAPAVPPAGPVVVSVVPVAARLLLCQLPQLPHGHPGEDASGPLGPNYRGGLGPVRVSGLCGQVEMGGKAHQRQRSSTSKTHRWGI
ncbi:unnamed protein product [Penicillium salamii]|nr:unnamed protein product [Penicillium salamii]